MKFINISPNGAVLFDSLVQKTPAFVKFYSEGCGHCKDMEDEWKKLKTEIKPYKDIDINVIDVNSKAIPNIKSKCAKNINGYPTMIEVLPGGEAGIEHTSERTTKELMKTIKKIMKKHKQKNTAGRPIQEDSEQSWDGDAAQAADEALEAEDDETARAHLRMRLESGIFDADAARAAEAFLQSDGDAVQAADEALEAEDDDDNYYDADVAQAMFHALQQSDDDNLETLEQISENTQNQLNRNNMSSIGMREIRKKAKIWAEYPNNTIAEQHHPVDGLSEEDEERLIEEASYIRAGLLDGVAIDLTGEGIKSRKNRKYKHRRNKTRGKKHGKKHGKKRRTRYRYVKRPKHYSRIRR